MAGHAVSRCPVRAAVAAGRRSVAAAAVAAGSLQWQAGAGTLAAAVAAADSLQYSGSPPEKKKKTVVLYTGLGTVYSLYPTQGHNTYSIYNSHTMYFLMRTLRGGKT